MYSAPVPINVRYASNSDQIVDEAGCRLSANSGHCEQLRSIQYKIRCGIGRLSVRDPLKMQLEELEQFSVSHDRKTADRSQKMLNITRDTGEFLSVLVRAIGARRVLELGTSNGYSTLWLASAVHASGGLVTTVELSDFKVGLAASNFAKSGLASSITLLHEDAGSVLARSAADSFDFVFLDTDRSRYVDWWPALKRILRPGAVLVADNATTHPQEMAAFIKLINADSAFATCIVPVGNGEFIAVKG
jgi:predicted O-methyltransferase YrrM